MPGVPISTSSPAPPRIVGSTAPAPDRSTVSLPSPTSTNFGNAIACDNVTVSSPDPVTISSRSRFEPRSTDPADVIRVAEPLVTVSAPDPPWTRSMSNPALPPETVSDDVSRRLM